MQIGDNHLHKKTYEVNITYKLQNITKQFYEKK